MADKFLELLVTPSVSKAQERYFGRAMDVRGDRPPDALTEDEREFIRSRDSFYLSTVSESGWPYLQHRGGQPGFLHVVNATTLAFADYKGNSAAVAELRAVLLGGLRVALRDRSDVSEAHLEDFAQDALLKVLARLDQFSGRSKFTTWAHAIALNTAFAELRRKRWRDVSLESLLADGRELSEPAILAEGLDAADEERTRLLQALREAVAEKLSDKQRAVIAGSLDGLPFDQIVALLGTNRNAAYKLLHDARRTLKQHLTAAGISTETIRTAFAP